LVTVAGWERHRDFAARSAASGDDCLRQIASALGVTILRPADLVARYGGEEFAILLPGTDADGARDVGEKLRMAVEALALPHGAAGSLPFVSTSIGCATAWPQVFGHFAPSDLIQAADRALYSAKNNGRNQIAC
jgi:diguanylate cyclase (GGDEF)-like protein